MKSKNVDIQLFKFLYSCLIVIYHLASSTRIVCPGGYYGVEYFLLTSGLFLFLSFDKKEGTDALLTPGQFFAKRFWRFLPWSITGFLAAVFVQRLCIEKTVSPTAWLQTFPSDLWEILMAKGTGINAGEMLINGPAWTISSLLIVGALFWTLLYYYKQPFIRIIMPLSLVLGFGIWANLPSADTAGWIGFTTFGTFRTWLIFCLSYYCMLLGKKLSTLRLNKAGQWTLTVIELLLHGVALYYVFTSAERPTQWMLTGLFMLSIAIAVSGHSYLARALDKASFINFLGEVSISIYLIHSPVIVAFRYVFDLESWGALPLIGLCIAILVAAFAHYYGTLWLLKGFRRIKARVQRALTEE